MILNIIPSTERTFQSQMLTSLRKSSSLFSLACFRLTYICSVQSFFYLLPKCLFSVCLLFTKGFAYLLC